MSVIPAGFPSEQEAVATLNDAAYQNRHDLRHIANDIVGFLGQIEDANKADYRSIANQINAKLSSVRRLNGKDCEQLADLVAEMDSGFTPPETGGSPTSQPITPNVPHTPQGSPSGFTPWVAVFCCAHGTCAGPHIFVFPNVAAVDMPLDLLGLVSYGEVDANGNYWDASPPAGSPCGTGCTINPKILAPVDWNKVRSEIAQCQGLPPPLPPAPCPVELICPPGQHWDSVACACVPDNVSPPPPPPPPPPPTPPPTPPTPGSDCNNPLHIVICPDSTVTLPPRLDQCPSSENQPPVLPEQPPEQPPPESPPPEQPLFIASSLPPARSRAVAEVPSEQQGESAIIQLCSRLIDAAESIVALGNDLIHSSCDDFDGWTLGVKVLSSLAVVVGDPTMIPPPAYFDAWQSIMRHFRIDGIARNMMTADSIVFGYDRIRARNITAVKTYLEGLRDLASGLSLDGGTNAKAHYSLGVEVFGLGGSVSGESSRGESVSLHVSLHAVVIPSIAACELLLKWEMETEIPKTAEAIHAWLMGELTSQERDCLLRMNNVNPALWDKIAYAQRERLTVDEIIEWSRRNNQTFDQTLGNVQAIGWMDRSEAIARMSLYDELPNQADFLHYLQRNVYDTEYVNDYGLLEGFDERYWANFGAQLSAIGVTYERAKLDYAAHWQRPSPEQFREFVYRLNPDYYQGENPTTADDYKRTLTEQDYSPYDVKRFGETLYRVPALGYIRDMYRQYVIGDDELINFHRQLGYAKEASEQFLGVDKIVRERQRTSESHGWTTQALAGAFASGVKDANFVSREMDRLGFSQDEANNLMERSLADLQRMIVTRARSRVLFSVLTQVKQSLTSGIIDSSGAISSIVALGWPLEFAAGWVEVQTSALRVKLVNQTVGRIRSAFLSGEIDLAYARESLTRLALVPLYIEQTLLSWELSNTPSRKRRSASQIVNDLSYGMLSTSEALVRLTNLGYPEADQLLYLADAQRKLTTREAKELAAAQRSARSQANELVRLEKEALAQANRIQGVRRRVASKGTLMVWAKNGIIDKTEFVASMEDLNYDADNIERYWLQACEGKTAQCVTSPAAAKGPPASGDGSVYTEDELGGIMP